MSQAAVPKKELTLLLAAALGEEKSDELVTAAARRLDLPHDDVYTLAEARAIFECIATADGLVGVVARFVITRGDVDGLRTKICAARVEQIAAGRRFDRREGYVDLTALLAPVLGTEKAREAIASAAATLGADDAALTRETAKAVLDLLGQTEGIVGVVARFARTRVGG